MYLPVLYLLRTMWQDNFKSILLFIPIWFYLQTFFVYTNFLDSWDTILDRTIQIQFTYLQKIDSGCVLYFVKVVFSNKFLNTGRNTDMPKDVNWLDDAQNKKSKWN